MRTAIASGNLLAQPADPDRIAEETYLQDHPLRSVYGFQAILDRVGSGKTDVLGHIMEQLVDGIENRHIKNAELCHKQLRAPKTSIVEVLKLQLALREKLLTEVLPNLSFPSDIKKQIQDLCASATAFRKKYKPWPNKPAVDTGYLVKLSGHPGACEFINAMDALCYSAEHFTAMHACVKVYKTVDDFVEYPSITEILSEITSKHAAGTDPSFATPTKTASALSLSDLSPGPIKDGPQTGMAEEDKIHWTDFATNQRNTWFKAICMPKSISALVSDVSNSELNRSVVTDGTNSNCLLICNLCNGKEAKSRPDLRVSAFDKMQGTVLKPTLFCKAFGGGVPNFEFASTAYFTPSKLFARSVS